MTRDTLRCAACDVPGRIFEPLPGMPMLGHVRQPDPIHAFRLAPASRSAAVAPVHVPVPGVTNGGCEDNQRQTEASEPVRGRETPVARCVPQPRTTQARSRSGRSSADLPAPPAKATRRQPPPAVGRRSPERSSTAASPSLGGLPTAAGRG